MAIGNSACQSVRVYVILVLLWNNGLTYHQTVFVSNNYNYILLLFLR